MRRMRFATLAALAVPMLAGCVDDQPFPVANSGLYSTLPPLPPPDYGTPATTPARRAVRRIATRASAGLTDDQIRIRILQGGRHACVPGAPCVCPDVTPDMIAEWRRQHGA